MPLEEIDIAGIVNLIMYAIVATALLILVFGFWGWMKNQKNKKVMGDVDWEEEKERLLFIASEKKARREAEDSKEKASSGETNGS
jgi:Flp pilus assembly protein TadB